MLQTQSFNISEITEHELLHNHSIYVCIILSAVAHCQYLIQFWLHVFIHMAPAAELCPWLGSDNRFNSDQF